MICLVSGALFETIYFNLSISF